MKTVGYEQLTNANNRAICMMASFAQNYQNLALFLFLMLISAIVVLLRQLSSNDDNVQIWYCPALSLLLKLLVQMLYFLKFLVGVQSHFKFRKIGGGPKPLNREIFLNFASYLLTNDWAGLLCDISIDISPDPPSKYNYLSFSYCFRILSLNSHFSSYMMATFPET